MFGQKPQQKFCAVFGLLLVIFSWAPVAAAEESFFDGLINSLALVLGLASGPSALPADLEMPYNPSPGGFAEGGDKSEMPYNPSPGGLAGDGDDRPEMPYNPSPGG